ncbi:MAG: hypothetical protein V2I57_02325 [Xanthomonadales bacterium]|nr:hypothetical protein [Xanthomonadales bacterium]
MLLPSGFQDLEVICEEAARAGRRFDPAALREAFRLDWVMRARRSASG